MISMLDRDMSGTMGFNEFKELWAVLNGWRQHFMTVDSDRSGTVDSQELQKALMSMGFRLSPQAISGIVKRYSCRGKISFDDYIACCVKLRALTDSFRRRDAAQQGMVNFQYDDFIQCVMSI
ncbi:sorcin isoform 2-T2 [Liasis olivaceus]